MWVIGVRFCIPSTVLAAFAYPICVQGDQLKRDPRTEHGMGSEI